MPDTTPVVIEKQEEEVLSREQAELLIRLMRENTQTADSYIERMNAKTGNPVLFDTERN